MANMTNNQQQQQTQSFKYHLGDKVRDTLTTYEGIVTAQTAWISGAHRYQVESQALHNGAPVKPISCDENTLKLLESSVIASQQQDGIGTHQSQR